MIVCSPTQDRLRSPISTPEDALAGACLRARGTSNQMQKRQLTMIKGCATRMLDLVTNIMEMAKAEKAEGEGIEKRLRGRHRSFISKLGRASGSALAGPLQTNMPLPTRPPLPSHIGSPIHSSKGSCCRQACIAENLAKHRHLLDSQEAEHKAGTT